MNNKTYDASELLEKHEICLKNKQQEINFLLKEMHFAESKIEFFNNEKESFRENINNQKLSFARFRKTIRFFLITITVLMVLQFEFPIFNTSVSKLLIIYFCVAGTAFFGYQWQKQKLKNYMSASLEYDNDSTEIIDKLEGCKTKIKFLNGEIQEIKDITSILEFGIDKENIQKKLSVTINANKRLINRQTMSEVSYIQQQLDAQKNTLVDECLDFLNCNLFIFNNNDVKRKVFAIKQKAEDYTLLYKKLTAMVEEYTQGNFDKYQEHRETFISLSYLVTEKINPTTETSFGGLRKIG